MILPKWNLDTDTFTIRIRVKDKCVLTDYEGFKHFKTLSTFCNVFTLDYDPVLGLESLVESFQAIWVDLNEEEKLAYNRERPWWKKLLRIGELK